MDECSRDRLRTRLLIVALRAAVVMVVSACTGLGRCIDRGTQRRRTPSLRRRAQCGRGHLVRPGPRWPPSPYTIGSSNTGGTGNGFPRGAEPHRQGRSPVIGLKVSEITVITHDTDAAGQPRTAATCREGCPGDRLQSEPSPGRPSTPGPRRAKAAGIKTVVVDAYVTDPDSTTCTTTRSSTRSSAPRGCSNSWAARAPSSTCAGSPATRPTPTETSGSRTRSRTFLTSRWCLVLISSPPAGTRQPQPTLSWAANEFIASGCTTRSRASGTSGIDSEVVDAIRPPGKPYGPIVRHRPGPVHSRCFPRLDRLSRP